jgi:hypothetical protein
MEKTQHSDCTVIVVHGMRMDNSDLTYPLWDESEQMVVISDSSPANHDHDGAA